ncbi:2-oxoacid:ferredoxin oxidoreductase subunit beta, partial [Saccharothrix sp. S26]|nr:2-oxoacid:ferredoxin oxidoreductase subunit beta [Saccharothrix sp. S26]
NCPIFNDGAFDVLKDSDEAARRIINVIDGQPITFGNGEFAVVRDGFGLAVAKTADVSPQDVVVHDASDLNLSFALSRLSTQDLQHTVTGVFRNVNRTTYDDAARAQVEQAKAAKPADLRALLHGKDTWTVS